jgi:cell surface hyaluronidase
MSSVKFLFLLLLNPVFTGLNLWLTAPFAMTDSYVASEPITVCRIPVAKTFTTISCIQNGNWQSPSTWSTGTVPTSVDDVMIDAAFVVTLTGTINANSITVMGTLKPATVTTNFTITTKGIMVMGSSALFEIGSVASPYTGNCTITLTGSTTTDVLFTGMGTKVIGAMSGGTIRFEGLSKNSWVNLGANAAISANSITLSEAVNWQIGDEIVITSSRPDWNEAEKRTITAKSADNKTISFSTPLAYPHTGIINSYTRPTDGKTWTTDLRAEVGLLTHNIKVQGDASSTTNGFGGHIMAHQSGKAFLSNVELYRMGQKAKQGRYPIHWHMLATEGNNQFIKNSSIHQSFNRAVTIHGTHGITVQNNFMYDHIGHGIFLENGSEINNTITHNVVLLTKRPAPGEELTPSDNSHDEPQNRTPSSYWITNPNNVFTNNVAAGTQGTGYWYALAQNFMFESLNDPRFAGQTKPYEEVFGGFTGNIAHSCMNGMDIFDRVNVNHAIVANSGWIEPSIKVFSNNHFYANEEGIYGGIGNGRNWASKVIFSNCTFVENRFALFLANYSINDQSLFVANSGQNLRTGERFLYEVYDGAATVKNAYLVGWDSANANLFANSGAAQKHANHLFENLTFNHSGPPRISYPDFIFGIGNYSFNENQPTVWNAIFRDKTGSITSHPDYSIISNHPMLTVGDEQTFANWTNIFYTPRNYVFSIIHMNYNITPPNISITRTKPGLPDVSFYDIFSGPFLYHQMSLIVNDGFEYTYQFENLPVTKVVEQRVMDASVGDNYVSRYKNFGKLGGLSVTSPTGGTFINYTSASNLRNGTNAGYFVEPNGDVYIKAVASEPDQIYKMTWTTDFTVPPLDTDGDGFTDSREVTIANSSGNRSPNTAKDLFFGFNTTTENWTTAGSISSNTVGSNNCWQLNSNGNDPQILRTNLNFSGLQVPTVGVKLTSTLADNTVKLYWKTVAEPTFSEDKSVYAVYTTINEQQILTFVLQNNPQWDNQYITDMRINLPRGTGVSKIYSIGCFDTFDYDGDGLTGIQENALCRDPANASDFSIDFNEPYEAANTFATNGIANFSISNGIVQGTAVNDPHFFQNRKYNFKGRFVPKLIVKIKASASGVFQLFWENEDGGFDEARSVTKSYTGNDTWQYVELDLSAKTNWMGKMIKSLRIDPTNVAGVNFAIDWIRAVGYKSCACTNATTLLATVNGWSYYGNANTNEVLFGIEHNPVGGNTLPFTASVSINKTCLDNKQILAVKNTTAKEATLVGENYWNIAFTGGSTNGYVNIRFFTDSDVNALLQSETNTFFTTNNATSQSPALYFKSNNKIVLPADLRSDGKGFNYAVFPLMPAGNGTYSGKPYVQFNQVNNINNSGGGIVQKVTSLNQNSFLSPSQLEALKGTIRYNKDFDRFEGFNGVEWFQLSYY